MTTIQVTGSETVACVVLCDNLKLNNVALKNAIRLGASRLVVLGDDSQIIESLRQFFLTKEEVEAFPSNTPLPVGANVVVYDAARFEQASN